MAARLGKTSLGLLYPGRAKKILPEEVRKKMLCNVAGAHSLTRALIFCLICGTGRASFIIIVSSEEIAGWAQTTCYMRKVYARARRPPPPRCKITTCGRADANAALSAPAPDALCSLSVTKFCLTGREFMREREALFPRSLMQATWLHG